LVLPVRVLPAAALGRDENGSRTGLALPVTVLPVSSPAARASK
jgi:hypothetical protein